MIGRWMDTEAGDDELRRIADATRWLQYSMDGCLLTHRYGGASAAYGAYLTTEGHRLARRYDRLNLRYERSGRIRAPAVARVVRLLQDRARRALASRTLAQYPHPEIRVEAK